MGSYRTAQICLNGHVTNTSADAYPETNQKFCNECGAETIMNCPNPNCKAIIRGDYSDPEEIVIGFDYTLPKFCHNCGKPYPWTESRLKAAQELVHEFVNLSDDEKDQLAQSIDDIVRDTPQTVVATSRFKRLVSKAGKEAADGLKSIMVDIISETLKKSIGLS